MKSSLETIAPGLLLASPSLTDPNFSQTVVLMCIHNENGAMGFVLNRPAPITTAEIMGQLGMKLAGDKNPQAKIGGPVAVESGVLLYRPTENDVIQDDELVVSETIRLCPSRDLLRSISEGRGPDDYNIFLGHAGWAPGQLEVEIAQGAWIPAPLRDEIVFGKGTDQLWEEAIKLEGLQAALLGSFRPQN